MDFVERWFGISPDGGNGTFEAALVLGASVILLAVVWFARLMRRSGHRSRGGQHADESRG